MIAELELASEERATYNIDFVDLCEELDTLEKRVIVHS
jgi:hypothetical protein